MFTEEIILTFLGGSTLEEWYKDRLEQFRDYEPNYWLMGNILDGVSQVNLFGFKSPSLPDKKLSQIFEDKNKAVCYFADAKCIYEPLDRSPGNTSLIAVLDSGINVSVTGMFVIGGNSETSITGMDLDTTLKVFSRIVVNPRFAMHSIMEP